MCAQVDRRVDRLGAVVSRPAVFPTLRASVAAATAFLLLVTVGGVGRGVNGVAADEAGGRSGYFTDQWAVEVDGTEEDAKRLAQKHGFVYVDKIMDNFYMFKHRKVSKRSVDPTKDYEEDLGHDPKAAIIQTQRLQFDELSAADGSVSGVAASNAGLDHHQQQQQQQLFGDLTVSWMQQQVAKKRVKRGEPRMFNDPKWPRMWYLNRGIGFDMNVVPAWQKGFTGKGIVVTILDDGIEKDHPDLKTNYDPLASYDVNEHDSDPQPRYDNTDENRHGTRCAGEVAAESNNSICSTGIAYNARIGGVRMLDGDVTDAVEAQSLSLRPQHIDIYSASWGPDDDGRTVDGPGPLAWRAFQEGVAKGRGGLGSIFVWASGNGGQNSDSCNCDGYTNSIYTLSISSATENGHVPWYSEACPSSLATTYSSGSGFDRQIVTTDLRKGCTEMHTGTSASAPLAAGIFALVLEANPSLTWRDLQHIVVLTSRKANLVADDWIFNAVGRQVSHHFGYGLLDVDAMVTVAQNWTSVPEQHRCQIDARISPRGIIVGSRTEISLSSAGCVGQPNEVRYVEHVQAIVTLTSSRRGDVEVYLTSPGGTRSTLLTARTRDQQLDGFNEWAFMTTHSWGESSVGVWKLEVRNGHSAFFQARFSRWSLVLYGTAARPHYPAPYLASSHPADDGDTPLGWPSAPPPTTVSNPARNQHSQAVLKDWSLVMYGSAEHPLPAAKSGHQRSPEHQGAGDQSAVASLVAASDGMKSSAVGLFTRSNVGLPVLIALAALLSFIVTALRVT